MCDPKSGGAETSFRPPSLKSEGASAPLAPPVPTPMTLGTNGQFFLSNLFSVQLSC